MTTAQRGRTTSPWCQAYGKRVRAAREATTVTQKDLGVALGLTRSSVANIESGRQTVSAEHVMATAQALGCDPRWLLTGWESDHVVAEADARARASARTVAGHLADLRALAAALEAAWTPAWTPAWTVVSTAVSTAESGCYQTAGGTPVHRRPDCTCIR